MTLKEFKEYIDSIVCTINDATEWRIDINKLEIINILNNTTVTLGFKNGEE